ncbi:hypothetical protein RHSIM_Rhsim04G0238400 [Rhododendron simsii]|uniref:Jacalin-type lectin domain-containing protein n=1 Tax=Rhododendron simsii TaxID=118357 RepID=A0A834H2E8_RHOSS|nr:hypothetical protein RHSIM_Rhsim04G0238400 [Rhododendron simsii]
MAHALRLSFLLLVFCLSISKVLTIDLVDGVCAKTKNPSFCRVALRSNARSATANLTELGGIAIDLTLRNSIATLTKINTLKGQTKEFELRKRLESCFTEYEKVVETYCPYAKGSMAFHDYIHMYAAGDFVRLSYPSEFLSGITGWHVSGIIRSLTFITNKRTDGPFGGVAGNIDSAFEYKLGEDNKFARFHGTAGTYNLNSIGVYLKPMTTLTNVNNAKGHIKNEKV